MIFYRLFGIIKIMNKEALQEMKGEECLNIYPCQP